MTSKALKTSDPFYKNRTPQGRAYLLGECESSLEEILDGGVLICEVVVSISSGEFLIFLIIGNGGHDIKCREERSDFMSSILHHKTTPDHVRERHNLPVQHTRLR